MVKRTFDIIAALVGLVITGPLFLVLLILIKLDSPGPGFYRAPRVGKNGRLFRMVKFRTMVVDADTKGPALTYKNDPRITRLGAKLRASRLDELPQLINVLKGEMSLVGPRPESPDYVARYSPEQRAVLRVKPGMTGPMQIAYLDEEEQLSNLGTVDDDYLTAILPSKLAIELDYIRNRSLFFDISVLMQTLKILLLSNVDHRNG